MAISYNPNMMSLPTPSPFTILPSNYNFASNMGLFDAIGGVIGSGINAITGSIQNRKNRKFQREMQDRQNAFTERMWNQQNDWNLEMWNRENEYNSPAAQMQRMMDAGINPNSAAGGIAGNGAGQASPVQADLATGAGASGQGVAVPLGDVGSSLVQNLIGMAQVKNIEADTELKEKQSGNVEADTLLKGVEKDKAEQEVKDLIFKNTELNPKTKEQMEATISKTWAERDFTVEDKNKIIEQTRVFAKQVEVLDKQIDELQEQINLLKEKQKTEQSTQANLAVNSQLAEMNARLSKLQGDRQSLENQYESSLQEVGMSLDQSDNPVLAAAQTAAVNANKAAKTVAGRKKECAKYNEAHKGEDTYLYVNAAGQVAYGSHKADEVKAGKKSISSTSSLSNLTSDKLG